MGRGVVLVVLALGCGVAPLGAVDRTRQGGGGGKEDFLTGVWGGRRTAWSVRGFDVGLVYMTGAYRNLTGGLAAGGTFEGTADLNLDLDFAKAFAWPGARLHASAAAGHGPGVSARLIGDVNKVSSFYLDPGLYLHEVWFEQTWLDGALSLRAGKLSMDLEFPVYGYADAIPLPLFPAGALGARLRYAPNPSWSFQAAVYDGDPTDGQGVNRHGTQLRLGRRDGATAIAEVAVNLGAEPNATFPTGTWKLGAFHSTRDGADPATGARRRGNHSLYLNGDQTLWRENPKVKDDAQGLALYLVGEYAPPDRNSYHYGFGGGPYYTGLIPGRDADVLYFSILYSRFGRPYSAAAVASGGAGYFFENRWQLTYQIVVTKYFSVTPEIDYVERPGGTGTLRNATVLGLRTNLTF